MTFLCFSLFLPLNSQEDVKRAKEGMEAVFCWYMEARRRKRGSISKKKRKQTKK
jgi:hypothetical protein